ncbi:OmpP1/FadL family transporter [Acinetobacter sp.]|uniref:OmpP1/FadL family transporter n=1 Tax=Acinetobacter sp. TaxID=472 RepID=UPI0026487F97|nr:outer membrane protein transport protein [Acinetobacter sp.]MDN5512399.1 outer membrane protein transport protein [Acinetobacter sp.]MDN5524987.1 outer membrane protein transport protein [Acinetobacter sp.]
MKLNTLSMAIFISTLPLTSVIAGGLDRSGQSISAFLQPGNYAEAGFTVIDPTVEGKDIVGNQVSDMGDDYYFPTAAVKIQATDQISLGLLYDQPYGADATYAVENSVFADKTVNQGTRVEVKTNNVTALIGYQPNKNWNFYAGPVYQTVEGKVSLRGAAYGGPAVLGGYDINFKEAEAYGWLAGAAYSIPEIALKAAVTYRSEIKHELNTTESFAFGKLSGLQSETEVVTPQSVNLDLQSGIAKNTLAFANIRWVQWDQFAVAPKNLHAKSGGKNLIDYSDDQWSITTGISRKINDKWAGTASVGWDSGAGNPVTTLGPVEGNWNVGLGAQYSPAESYFIAAGVKYLWLGDAKAQTGGNVVGDFEDNTALAYGMKIGYRF